ncbi:copper-binding protein, partial [Mesorhizobium sp.]
MKLLAKAFSALALALAVGGSALAQEYVKGEVIKVDAKQKKLTIKHEPLTNLDMPAMTMVFVVAEQGMLDKVKTGQAIEFTADR